MNEQANGPAADAAPTSAMDPAGGCCAGVTSAVSNVDSNDAEDPLLTPTTTTATPAAAAARPTSMMMSPSSSTAVMAALEAPIKCSCGGCCGCCGGGACACEGGESCSCRRAPNASSSSSSAALDASSSSRTSLCRCAAAELLETLGQLKGGHGGRPGAPTTTAVASPSRRLGSADAADSAAASELSTNDGLGAGEDPLANPAAFATTTTSSSRRSGAGLKVTKEEESAGAETPSASSSTTTSLVGTDHVPDRTDRRHNGPPDATQTTASASRIELEVDGMTCSMCSQAIEAVVRGLSRQYANSRVLDVRVNLGTDTVLVEWEDAETDPDPELGKGGSHNNRDGSEEEVGAAIGEGSSDNDSGGTTKHSQSVITEQAIVDAIEGIGYTVAGVLSSGRTHKMPAGGDTGGNSRTSAGGATSTPNPPPSRRRNNNSPLLLPSNALPPQQLPSRSTPVAAQSSSHNTNHSDSDWTNVQRRWDRLQERQAIKVRRRRDAFVWAFVLAAPIVFLTMVLPHVAPQLAHKFESIRIVAWNGWQTPLQAVLLWMVASAIQFGCGWEFYRGTWYAFKSRKAGMDVLVCLGTTASYLYAMYGVFVASPHPHSHTQHWEEDTTHFFETSSMLIAFVLAGKWMQAAAVQRTSSALTSLLSLRTLTAIKITPFKDRQNFHPLKDPYKEATVPIEDVREGDLVKILPGNSIPADGKIVFGQVSVDESMLTGESLPVYKSTGTIVLGGTVCVESSTTTTTAAALGAASPSMGAAFVQVTGVGSATALSQIIKLVTDAQMASSATPIQNFADTIASIFVPTVALLSILTTLCWYVACRVGIVPHDWYGSDTHPESAFTFSLLFGIAVMVISCPCALGLATPTAIMVGTGVGAKLGVLIKSGQAAETAAKVDVVVFDKTGTLTRGSPAITDFFQLDEPGEFVLHGSIVDPNTESSAVLRQHFLWLLASLERTSTHPLAKAVVSYASDKVKEPLAQPTEFIALTGRGASALVNGIPVACGNRAFAHALNLPIPRTVEECMVSLEDEGKTAILAAINNKVCVVMGLADEIKPDAATSIAYLREKLGVEVWMVTGDNPRTAHAVGHHLGIPSDRVISEALPATKVQRVQQMQGEGRVVCFVGDGINDSPALAQADVGLSVGTGTEIAAEASDMVLVAGNVSDVCTALDLSRAIFRRIQWNFVWSLMYNCLGIPIAAGALYPLTHIRLPPPVAAIAMALSSISVVLSSMALRLYRPPDLNSGGSPRSNSSSSSSTTLWARVMRLCRCQAGESPQRSRRRGRASPPMDDEDPLYASLSESLLESDHLLSSSSAGDVTESTRCTDNRTASRLEAGTLLRRAD